MAARSSESSKGAGQSGGQVRYVDSCTLVVTHDAWPFAEAHAAEIDAFWQLRTAENATLFNGRIFMLSSYRIHAGRFSGRLVPVEFKAFLFWKERGCPDRSVFDVFGSALIRADDGAILLGRQKSGINAGLIYLPGGFIDQRDVDEAGEVDISASVLREIEEETGLGRWQLGVRDGFLVTTIGAQISIAVELVADGDAETVRQRIREVLAAEAEPELDEIVAVREWAEVEALPVPAYAQVLLAYLLHARLPV
jgi:ADP-ribose pyrophosphatase YjhB (NUDIX family)